MDLPDYWLSRPAAVPGQEEEFDRLLRETPHGGEVVYDLEAPKWQFLCHAGDRAGFALHGSGDPGIREFEPRQSNDLNEFGNQKAVYAASDGLWAMFFAVVERSGLVVTNAAVRLIDPEGSAGEPHYFFAISSHALARRPWRPGTVYLLPRAGFVAPAPLSFGAFQVEVAQLASFSPVVPVARITVAPEDFPFLDQIRGHDDDRLAEYGAALASGAPLPE